MNESDSAPRPAVHEEDDAEVPYVWTSFRYDELLETSLLNTAASFNMPCPFYMLEHHWTRLQVAATNTQSWSKSFVHSTLGCPSEFLQGLRYAVTQWHHAQPKGTEPAKALRIRRRMYANGRVSTEIWQVPRIPLDSLFSLSFHIREGEAPTAWTCVLDCQPTEPTEATMFKISDRSLHNRARADAGIASLTATKEVLLYDSSGNIVDASICTTYFYRNGEWVTPVSSSGGLQGTTRRWALENGLCNEDEVKIGSLTEGEMLWLSNAVKGYFRAVYRTRKPDKFPDQS